MICLTPERYWPQCTLDVKTNYTFISSLVILAKGHNSARQSGYAFLGTHRTHYQNVFIRRVII